MTWKNGETMTVRGALIYGPPRSRRGQTVNRIRVALGLPPVDEVYAVIRPYSAAAIDIDADSITVKFTDEGLFVVEPIE